MESCVAAYLACCAGVEFGRECCVGRNTAVSGSTARRLGNASKSSNGFASLNPVFKWQFDGEREVLYPSEALVLSMGRVLVTTVQD